MKIIIKFLILSLLIVQGVGAQSPVADNYQSVIRFKKDSVWKVLETEEGIERLMTYNRLASFYFAEAANEQSRDTVFILYNRMMDEAKRQGDKYYQGIAIVNKLLVLSNHRMYDRQIEQAAQDLKQIAREEIGERFYYQVYRMMVQGWQWKGEYDKAIAGAKEMYSQARADGYTTGMGLSLYVQARVCHDLGKYEEQINISKESIRLLEEDEKNMGMINTIWFDICKALLALKQYDNALIAAAELEKVTERYEADSKTSVPTSRMNLYMIYTRVYCAIGDYDLAEHYCDRLESIGGSTKGKIDFYLARAEILNHRKQYDDAFVMIQYAEELLEDYYSIEGTELLERKLEIQANREQANQTYDIALALTAVNDSIRKVEYSRQLDEVRTIYEVDRHILEKDRNHNYFLFALVGCLLLLILLIVWMSYSRRLREKNRNLVRRLREQDELASRLDKERAAAALLRLEKDEVPGGEATESYDPLYTQLLDLMNQEIYTDPALNRIELATRMTTNERYLADLVKSCFNQTVGDFITSYRLRHARRLLADPRENYTVEAAARDSGLGGRATLHQLFRKYYGISPSDFRRLSLEELVPCTHPS